MLFYSTNKKAPLVTFEQAVLAGLAPDGGLYMPQEYPVLSKKELGQLADMTVPEIGNLVLSKWAGDVFDSQTLSEIAKNALSFPILLQAVGDKFVLELFHGPTMAFKDIAARVLAQLLSKILEKRNKKTTILVATSGDTGGAIAQAFAGIQNINVVILFHMEK